jgi:hypothetical protein
VDATSPGPGPADPDRHPRDRLVRTLSLGDATLLVVSSVIGSGIFLAPREIATQLPHAGLILAAWTAGGLLSLAGALANAELGAMYPRGRLRPARAYHPCGIPRQLALVFVIYAGTVATLAVGFAEGSPIVPLDPAGAPWPSRSAFGLNTAASMARGSTPPAGEDHRLGRLAVTGLCSGIIGAIDAAVARAPRAGSRSRPFSSAISAGTPRCTWAADPTRAPSRVALPRPGSARPCTSW